ncbi:hypothetical protein [Streptomyces sp. NPDC058664]|uniref:hypothetical protein n=1 Tax=unclassified Streptomyces TaxID=2593676 RepID=UPI003654F6FC
MQDGSIGGEEASAWLREHFADDPAPEISISFAWDASAAPDRGAYERLLEILFTPRPGDLAA